MKSPNKFRITKGPLASDDSFGPCGAFEIPFENNKLRIISTDGIGAYDANGIQWEHVSVSLSNRCPNWREMCFIKSLFWEEDDCVIQYHPPKKDYINNHPYCLHMWRPVGMKIPMPPKIFVGVK